jgi:hypothetical protein
MKKIVLVYGIIAGIIVMPMLILLITTGINSDHQVNSMLIGYTNMLLAFSMIFFGVHAYKKKHLNGSITFWRALATGSLIALIGSTIYVIAWVGLSRLFYPEFVDDMIKAYNQQLETSNLSPDELLKKKKEVADMMGFYKTIPGMVLYTYMEILVVGLPMALISAIIFSIRKKKNPSENITA